MARALSHASALVRPRCPHSSSTRHSDDLLTTEASQLGRQQGREGSVAWNTLTCPSLVLGSCFRTVPEHPVTRALGYSDWGSGRDESPRWGPAEGKIYSLWPSVPGAFRWGQRPDSAWASGPRHAPSLSAAAREPRWLQMHFNLPCRGDSLHCAKSLKFRLHTENDCEAVRSRCRWHTECTLTFEMLHFLTSAHCPTLITVSSELCLSPNPTCVFALCPSLSFAALPTFYPWHPIRFSRPCSNATSCLLPGRPTYML